MGKEAERVETQTVSQEEGQHIAGNGKGGDEWDAGWGEDEDATVSDQPEEPAITEDDDTADAWGWNEQDDPVVADDNDAAAAALPSSPESDPVTAPPMAARRPSQHGPREMTLTEKYRISSMPESVLDIITSIIEDGTKLSGRECVSYLLP